jgi:hypothetical protein
MSAKCHKRASGSGGKLQPYDPGNYQSNKEKARESGGLTQENDTEREGATAPKPVQTA